MKLAREKATKEAVRLLSMFAGKNESVKNIEDRLNKLTNKQFDQYMKDLRDGKHIIPYIAPNLGKIRLSAEKNLEIAKKLGHNFFERLWLTDPATGEKSLSPIRYLVVDMPVRRLQQHLSKKLSIPDTNRGVDELTGQRLSTVDGSKISFPELQVLYSQGLESAISELIKFRGGDEQSYRAFTRDAAKGGFPSLAESDQGTHPTSVRTLAKFLRGMHLENTLDME